MAETKKRALLQIRSTSRESLWTINQCQWWYFLDTFFLYYTESGMSLLQQPSEQSQPQLLSSFLLPGKEEKSFLIPSQLRDKWNGQLVLWGQQFQQRQWNALVKLFILNGKGFLYCNGASFNKVSKARYLGLSSCSTNPSSRPRYILLGSSRPFLFLAPVDRY